MQKKRYAELQAESLRIEEEMAKAQARVKIYEEENIDQKVPLKTLTVADIKAGDSRYPVITKKQKYLDQDEKSSAATQFLARPRYNRFSTTNNEQGELQNNQHHQQYQQSSIIDDDTAQEWLKWTNNLMTLDGKSIARCLKPENFGNVVSCTLHHFSDACESGYGQPSYIRLLNQHGQVHCTLLIGKSRVAPLKFASIPRLELTAATLSLKISKMLKNELDIHVDDEIFWTDSKVVLGYINGDVRRFKVFVANRVQQIRDHTSPKQWHYVESSSNPADDASRGLDSKKKDQRKRWFDGPSFLWSRKQCWLEKFQLEEVSDEDPEVRKVVKVNFSNIQGSSMLSRLQEITSSWIKMKRIMALIMVTKGVWLNRINKV